MPDYDEFVAYLEKVSHEVRNWPEWKRDVFAEIEYPSTQMEAVGEDLPGAEQPNGSEELPLARVTIC